MAAHEEADRELMMKVLSELLKSKNKPYLATNKCTSYTQWC